MRKTGGKVKGKIYMRGNEDEAEEYRGKSVGGKGGMRKLRRMGEFNFFNNRFLLINCTSRCSLSGDKSKFDQGFDLDK